MNQSIYDLIARSFISELSDNEKLILDKWMSENHDNRLEYLDLKEIWEVSERLSLQKQFELGDQLKSTRKLAGINAGKKVKLKYFIQAAAVLIIALLLNGLYQFRPSSQIFNSSENVVFQQVKAAFGTQTKVGLPDGTVVSLNSGSTMSFPVSFQNQQERRVRLSGEGHFVVAKNSQQKFIVDANGLEIRVTGTTFNVECYENNSAITVALEEGSVVLQTKTEKGSVDLATMKPNEVAQYNKTENQVNIINTNDLYKYLAWKDGKIVFANDPVQTVVQKLSNWYNVEIVLADKKLEKYRFTGTFINEPVEQVLSILNLTSKMNYTIIPARKLADNSYSKRKIILKSK